MNNDFSINASIDEIQNAKTKEYFREVHQTFVNGNYRSSIVMLYSVLICDLVFKMKDLRDVYGDTVAERILIEIQGLQSIKPSSSEWELKLIELIKKRTTLFEPSDLIAIESLQKFRNLSAHPVITSTDLLFSPNKETVQSLIRNILEGILTKPPFLSNKIYPIFLNDLESIKDKITDDEDLKSYLNSRYLKLIKEIDFIKIFRSHWKIVFVSNDENSTRNLDINYRALKIIIAHNKDLCLQSIKNESSFYSKIIDSVSLTKVTALICRFPEIFNLLENDQQIIITKHIESEDNLKFIAWFTNGNFVNHLENVHLKKLKKLDPIYLTFIKKLAIENNCIESFNLFLNNFLSSSTNYEESTARFKYIETYSELTLDSTKKLLNISNRNDQIYGCFGMNRRIKNQIKKEIYDNIDINDYPNLWK